MPSSYTSNAGFEKPADGEQNNSWGDTVNDNMDILDRLTSQVGSIALVSTTYTLTTSTSGAVSEGHYSVIKFTGSPGGTCTVTISPNSVQRIYTIYNASDQTVTMTQGSGGNVSIASGAVGVVYCDGAGSGAAVVDIGELPQALGAGDSPSFLGLTVDTSTLHVDSSNNRVGVGLTTPSVLLDLLGSDLMHRLRSTTASSAYARYQATSGTLAVGIIGSIGYVGTTDASDLKLVANSVELMRLVQSSGRIGVGTTTPSHLFTVNGDLATTNLYIGGSQVSSTAAELNILDGATLSTAELNILDGVTATTAEINYVAGVTGAIQTQLDAKAANTTQDQATWEAGTGTTETVVSPAKVKAAIDALAPNPVGSALSWASWANGSESSVAHSLGSAPTIWFAYMECTSADAGFSVGAIVPINYSHSSAGYNGATTYADATNIYLRVGAGGFNTYSSSGVYTADFDPTKWTAKVRIIS